MKNTCTIVAEDQTGCTSSGERLRPIPETVRAYRIKRRFGMQSREEEEEVEVEAVIRALIQSRN